MCAMQTNFKIHGQERRKLKYQYSELKSLVKNSGMCVQMGRDMYSFYGGNKPLSDEENEAFVQRWTTEMETIKLKLEEEHE